MKADRKLIFEDGSQYYGYGFGPKKDVVCELVFNTSMVGYQEILSDPSYTDQGVVMSYPLIGNYGICDEDFESRMIAPSALIVRDRNENPSNFRAAGTLEELLLDHDVPGIYGADTRRIVRSIRDYGSRRGLVTEADTPVEEGIRRIRTAAVQHDAVRRCSCRKKWYSRTANPRYHVVAVDCGMKTNIIRMLNHYKCNVTIVPFDTGAADILDLKPDGLFISNGPGDPADVPEVSEMIREIRGRVPIFGICLGHQLIARACGARTYKLKFGHRGGNHPVREIRTGKIEITSQNHSYAVDENSLDGTGLTVSHINLLDGTVEGLFNDKEQILSVQYHPESAPGPCDSRHLFERFAGMMEERR